MNIMQRLADIGQFEKLSKQSFSPAHSNVTLFNWFFKDGANQAETDETDKIESDEREQYYQARDAVWEELNERGATASFVDMFDLISSVRDRGYESNSLYDEAKWEGDAMLDRLAELRGLSLAEKERMIDAYDEEEWRAYVDPVAVTLRDLLAQE